jgi:acyl carrier protein
MQKVSTPQVKPEDHPNSNIVPESLTPREKGMSQILRDIVVEVGGFTEQDIDYTMSLADLGIDSMMQIEIASKISRLFPGQTGIDHRALSECETLEEMDDMLSSVLEAVANQSTASQTSTSSHVTGIITPASSESSRTAGDMSGSQVLPVSLYSSGVSPTPLCLFHDGSGQIGMYKRLRGHDRTTYAFYDPKLQSFGGNRSFYHSIGEMAEDYASRLLGNTQSSTFTLILGGKSHGNSLILFQVTLLMFTPRLVFWRCCGVRSCPNTHKPWYRCQRSSAD